MPVILDLHRGIDPAADLDIFGRAGGSDDPQDEILLRPQAVVQAHDLEQFIALDRRVWAETPSWNCSGSTPMPTRLERWIRS
jgi:hypothetical protein